MLTPHSTQIIDQRRQKFYENSISLWKKQGFIALETTISGPNNCPVVKASYGRFWHAWLQYIYHEKTGHWEVWGRAEAINAIRKQIERPEETTANLIRDQVAASVSRHATPAKPTGSNTIIW